ncbi:MAG TPA: 3-dehydroquinate synthase family protein [Candidatus Cybelea sp.]|nr:3-dehydroquinate synthase family protein [Candidatus Cybelea sp.]
MLKTSAARNDDLGYPIVVSHDPAEELAAFVRAGRAPALILSDSRRSVRAIAARVATTLGNVPVTAFALGEQRKRLTTLERVLDAMLAAGVERDSLVLGVGGGVASDLFGFACATYMRGVRYAHVATSLVAMVDAAIGGKTGVDLRGGKNLAGVFADSVGVFCDTGALRTLPADGFREGYAEIVKAAIIEGGDLFELLEELSPHPMRSWPWLEVIPAAIKVKTMAVADDRLEAGSRATLNLGHTFAHAIERASRYTVSHGAAVALGLRAAGMLALRTGRFSEAEHLRVLALLALAGLPLQTRLAPEAIVAAMRNDKKRRGGGARFVLPRAIGDVEYGIACNDRTVRAVLQALARAPESIRARR